MEITSFLSSTSLGDAFQHLFHGLRFDRQKDDVAFFCQLAVVVGGFDMILLVQPFPPLRRTDIGDHQVFGFDEGSGQEALDHGLGHVAASDESYFFTLQHNRVSCNKLRGVRQ